MLELKKAVFERPDFWRDVVSLCDGSIVLQPRVMKHLHMFSREGVYLGWAGDGWKQVFQAVSRWLSDNGVMDQIVVFVHENSLGSVAQDRSEYSQSLLAQVAKYICVGDRLFVIRGNVAENEETKTDIIGELEFSRISRKEALEIIQNGYLSQKEVTRNTKAAS